MKDEVPALAGEDPTEPLRRRRLRWRLLVCAPVIGLALVAGAACTGDDETFRAALTYVFDGATFERDGAFSGSADGSAPSITCGDAAGAPPRLLVVRAEAPVELAAFNLQSRVVDGRYMLPEGGAGITSTGSGDPWFVNQTQGVVVRLDAREPWKPTGTWNIADDDAERGPARPVSVAQVSCTKAYVVSANRDRIAIIDPSQAGTDGTVTGFVDLSAFRGDAGALALATAVFVPAKRRVFVLAARAEAAAGDAPRCTDTEPSVFAIDVATDAVVSLAGKGPGGSITLSGHAPSALVYDAPFDRLIALDTGCSGAEGIRHRGVEQVDLATGAVSPLLDLNAEPRPTGLAVLDGEHAVIAFGDRARYWAPREPTLGPELAAEVVSLDGRGGFAGARFSLDAGAVAYDLLTIPVDIDAGAIEGARVLAVDPFSTPGGRAASLEPWPSR